MSVRVQGIITALITPFDEKENMDLEKLRRLIGFQIASGVDGIFIASSTGEAYTLDLEEKHELLELSLEAVEGRGKSRRLLSNASRSDSGRGLQPWTP